MTINSLRYITIADSCFVLTLKVQRVLYIKKTVRSESTNQEWNFNDSSLQLRAHTITITKIDGRKNFKPNYKASPLNID